MLGIVAPSVDFGDLTVWLITLHVMSAILLLGPSGAFSVLGKRSADPSTGGYKMLEALLEIEDKMVLPGAAVQGVTGVWLVVRLDYDADFWSNGWLWVSILAYLAIVSLSVIVDSPAARRTIKAASAGNAPDPKDIKTMKVLGPIFGILFAGIAFLMMTKPF